MPNTSTPVIANGRKSSIGNSAVQITATASLCRMGITFKAPLTNTDKVWLGGSGITCDAADSTDGFPLEIGETVTISVDSPHLVYARSPTAGQKVFWIGS